MEGNKPTATSTQIGENPAHKAQSTRPSIDNIQAIKDRARKARSSFTTKPGAASSSQDVTQRSLDDGKREQLQTTGEIPESHQRDQDSIRSTDDIDSIKARARKARTRASVTAALLRATSEVSQLETAKNSDLDTNVVNMCDLATSTPGAVAYTGTDQDMKVEAKNQWIDPMTEPNAMLSDKMSSNSHSSGKDAYTKYAKNPSFHRHPSNNPGEKMGKSGALHSASDDGTPDGGNVVNAPAMHLSAWKTDHEAMSVRNKVHLNRNLCIVGVVVLLGIIVGAAVAIGLSVGGKDEGGETHPTPGPVLPPTLPPVIVSAECIDIVADVQSERFRRFSENLGITEFDLSQRKALCWLADSDELQVNPNENTIAAQRFALATFYFSTTPNDSVGLASSNWLTAQSECEWLGVTCMNDEVQMLDLTGQSLVGTIAPELALLSGLSTLVLDQNELTGVLPEEIYGISSLTVLAFQQNAIGGSLSPLISNLQQLNTLSMGINKFTGTLPLELFDVNGLVFFFMYGSGLTGSIPSAIGGMSMLRTWAADENSLTGSIPSELGLCTALESLGLSGNALDSTIPTEIGLLVDLGMYQCVSWPLTKNPRN